MTQKNLLEFNIENLKYKKDFDLGEKSKEEWKEHIDQTLELLKNKTRKSYSKIKNHMKSIVPYGYIKGVQKSLSYVDSPGIIYLSFQDNPLIQAEAIIHEVNHTILFEFSQTDPGILNPYIADYYSAVQDKPRELQNCFLALHAFVHVLEFYIEYLDKEKMNNEILNKLFSTYLKTTSLLNIIEKYSSFTPKGKKLFEELKDVFQICERKIKNLEKKHNKEFKKAQEEQFKHFEKLTQEFENIKF